MDILSFNRYNGWYADPGKTEVIQLKLEAEAELWHSKYNKPVLVTEYGADTMPGLHLVKLFLYLKKNIGYSTNLPIYMNLHSSMFVLY